MISVIGREVTSARWKSSSNDSLSSLLALASPNSAIVKAGLAPCRSPTVASGASTRSSTEVSESFGGEGISNWTRTASPSGEICDRLPAASGSSTLTTSSVERSSVTAEATTSRNAWSSIVRPSSLRMRTVSSTRSGKLSARAWSAERDSPTP
jgi:hypothetical protein